MVYGIKFIVSLYEKLDNLFTILNFDIVGELSPQLRGFSIYMHYNFMIN